jgi:CysZ protein
LNLGFGAATAALTLIPVINFIAMPSAVAGATALSVKELSGGAGALVKSGGN